MVNSSKSIHLLAKPSGPQCNLSCKYCFYTEKTALYPDKNDYAMRDEILEVFIHKYIHSQQTAEVSFVWQGGEPTLLGLAFYQKAVSLQDKYADGRRIINSLQTNGTLLNDEWCRFFKANNFLVGLSLDGPEAIHDHYRRYDNGKPSFKNVIRGLQLLKKHQVSYNVLCCITREAAYKPIDIYHFFKQEGVKYIQFIPIVERVADAMAEALGLRLATPVSLDALNSESTVTTWSVEADVYGKFLIKVFDQWVKHDVGDIQVMNFEWALTAWLGLPSTVCVFAENCGESLVMEHDGQVFSCDHYVYPDFCLGNILTDRPQDMAGADRQRQFGINKSVSLPDYCRRCEAYFACRGECPKHRFLVSPDGDAGLNYLCQGYKQYFRHIHPYMKVMAQLIENHLPAAKVKDVIKGPLIVAR